MWKAYTGTPKTTYKVEDTFDICITNDDADAEISGIKDVKISSPEITLIDSNGSPSKLSFT